MTRDEVKSQLERMKRRKATGPDEFPVEVLKRLGDPRLDWITEVLQEVQQRGIPDEWHCSRISPLYKQKGDPLDFGSFNGI